MKKLKRGSFITIPNIHELVKLGDALAIATYVAICKFTDKKSACYPSVPKIAKACGASERTIQYRVKLLELLGFLKKIERKGNNSSENLSNLYQILFKPKIPDNFDLKVTLKEIKNSLDKEEKEGAKDYEATKEKISGAPDAPGGERDALGGAPDAHKLNPINQTQLTKSTILYTTPKNFFSESKIKKIKDTEKKKKKVVVSTQPKRKKKPSCETPAEIKESYTALRRTMPENIMWAYSKNNGEYRKFSLTAEDYADMVFKGFKLLENINSSANTLCYTPAQIQAIEDMYSNEKIGYPGYCQAIEAIEFHKNFKEEDYPMIDDIWTDGGLIQDMRIPGAKTPVSIRNEYDKLKKYSDKMDEFLATIQERKDEEEFTPKGEALIGDRGDELTSLLPDKYGRMKMAVGLLGSFEKALEIAKKCHNLEHIDWWNIKNYIYCYEWDGTVETLYRHMKQSSDYRVKKAKDEKEESK